MVPFEPGQRTNNRYEGLHNGLRHTIGIIHPNPFVTVQLLRRVDEEANSAFTKNLCGEDVRRALTRTANINTKITTVIERYMKHRRIIPPKQFLDQIAIVYMEYHHMEKMARRHVSLHLITLSKECLEEAMQVIAEQNNYDTLDNSTNDAAFVEQDIATEIAFNTTFDVSSICEHESGLLDDREREFDGDIPPPLEIEDGRRDTCAKERAQRDREEKKPARVRRERTPRRRRSSLLKRLARACEKARSRHR